MSHQKFKSKNKKKNINEETKKLKTEKRGMQKNI